MDSKNKLVSISGGKMSIYVSGKGSKTIVFLSGGLTSSPILDFKKLFRKLEDNFKVVVIEKFGYGFSSDSDKPRDVDTILEEIRCCLGTVNIEPPFILAPHSMSGIEALRWVEKYPKEIQSIIGLDMANYDAYSKLKINLMSLRLARFLVRMKITKLIPKVIESDAVKYGELSLSEKKLYSTLFYKNFTSKATWNEVRTVKRNAKKVENIDLRGVSLLIFSSNGKGTGIEKEKWISIQKKISKSSHNSEIFFLDCPHYIHNHKATEIARTIKNKL